MEIKRMSKALKEISGFNSDDPDNDPHNRHEYVAFENGDECCECVVCGVGFFGYRHRNECNVCQLMLAGGPNTPTQDPKYMITDGKICNIATGKPIPFDEPIFIFRAQDALAKEPILYYLSLVATEQHKTAIRHRLAHFREFEKENPERMKSPDTVYPFPKIADD